MRAALILGLIVITALLISPAMAVDFYTESYTVSGSSPSSVTYTMPNMIYWPNLDDFDGLEYIEIELLDSLGAVYASGYNGYHDTFYMTDASDASNIVGNGTIYTVDSANGIKVELDFTDIHLSDVTDINNRTNILDPDTAYYYTLAREKRTAGGDVAGRPTFYTTTGYTFSGNYYYWGGGTATHTPTPTASNTISVNVLEKYSSAALVGQAVTATSTITFGSETLTSTYGETLHFGVIPGTTYWFNASRAGYLNYNETFTIPYTPTIYTIYMERILTPIANHSYAHFSVVDQTNGGLIPNAEIRLSDGQTKLTNSAGYAWFSVNNSEQINYYVSKPSGYWPAYGAINLTSDESIIVALQRYTGPTATAMIPGWTPVTLPTGGAAPVVTLSAQLREQNVQEGMDVWYTNLPFISQFLFLLFIIGGLGLMAGGTRRN